MNSRLTMTILVLALCALVACVRVKAHERQVLAHPAMQGPVWVQESKADQHLFDVREASAGASRSVGGGCGCN